MSKSISNLLFTAWKDAEVVTSQIKRTGSIRYNKKIVQKEKTCKREEEESTTFKEMKYCPSDKINHHLEEGLFETKEQRDRDITRVRLPEMGSPSETLEKASEFICFRLLGLCHWREDVKREKLHRRNEVGITLHNSEVMQ